MIVLAVLNPEIIIHKNLRTIPSNLEIQEIIGLICFLLSVISNNFIIQWGRKATDGNTTTITLPTTFYSSTYCVSCWSQGTSVSDTGTARTNYGTWERISNSQFKSGAYSNRTVTFIAVG